MTCKKPRDTIQAESNEKRKGNMKINREKTRRPRAELSRPVRLGIEQGILHPDLSVHDYGCGEGTDVKLLKSLGFDVSGHDIDKGAKFSAHVVTCSYVINTVENPVERAELLKDAYTLARKGLLISARTDKYAAKGWPVYGDGFLNSNNSFQKFYSNAELVAYILEVTGKAPIKVANGLFYVSK